jgi:hypothetical protein
VATIATDEPLAIAAVQAIHSGQVDTLRRLLAEHPALATARLGGEASGDDAGMTRTLLHVATDWPGHFPNGPATVAALVAAGADINARFTGPHTETPLHWAASSDDVAVLDALIAAGADLEADGSVIDGGTPLANAVALVGLALTLRPTRHRFTADGRTLYAWCASDTLMFPFILGRPGTVESTCPHTGQAIRIEFTPDGITRLDPRAAVVSAVRPTGTIADVRTATCHHGHFFSSCAAAAHWADQHPDGYIHPVQEAFRLDRQVITQLGWDAPREQRD